MDGKSKGISISLRRLIVGLLLLLIVAVCGIIGFKILVPLDSWIDAVFMTIATMSTVGYTPPHALGQAGEVFAVFLIIGGAASVSLVVTQAAGLVLEEVFSSEIGRRRMEKKLRDLKNHYLVCGMGRMGSAVADIFAREAIPFVVIDESAEAIAHAQQHGYLFVHGDAASDEVLEAAGVSRARCLVALLSSDADNLYVTLSARQINPAISIIARAQDESGARKLTRAGATRVITPYLSGAQRLASAAIRPAFMDFIEALSGGSTELGFQFEELPVGEKSAAAGKTLASLNLGQQFGVIIVAIMRQNGNLVFNPGGKTTLETGDTLIAIGTVEQFEKMRGMLG